MASNTDTKTLLLIGGVALGGYALYRYFNASSKGIETATTGLGTGISDASQGLGGGIGSAGDWIKSIFDASASGFDRLKDYGNRASNMRNPNLINTQPVTASNPITSIKNNLDTAYGIPTVTVRQKNKSRTVIAAKNTYYKDLGIGFNSQGQGYSSAFAGNKAPTLRNNAYGLSRK